MNTFGLNMQIGANSHEIFEAITTPASLKAWLDEEVEIDLDGGVFDFWGAYSPGSGPGAKDLIRAVPNRELAFFWVIEERETAVEISLEAQSAGSTRLTLQHRSLPDHVWVSDFWHLALGNLASLVEGRSLVERVRLPEAPGERATACAEIDASPATVFAALTDPAISDRWFGRGSTIDARIGGRYDAGWGAGPIRIHELEPERLLVFSWNYAESGESFVRWEIEGSSGKTQLTLVHGGFAKPEEAQGYRLGWQAALVSLKRMLEVGPEWKRPETLAVSNKAQAASNKAQATRR